MSGGRAIALGVIVPRREPRDVAPREAPPAVGMRGFAALHARAKAGALSADERAEHRLLREAFLAAAVDVQNAGLKPGQTRRATVRIRRAIQVDLTGPGFSARAMTVDVGPGGFCALLSDPPPPGVSLRARVRVPRSRELDAVVTVVSARRRQRVAHVSFAFQQRTGDWSPFEDLVVDHVLSDVAAGGCAGLAEALGEWLRGAGSAGLTG